MTAVKKVLFQRNLLVFILITFFVIFMISISAYIFFTSHSTNERGEKSDRLNILLIVVDDLRPALGSYGDKNAITPNIDQLSARSVLFTNAYAQQSLGAPSRTSFLTGRRPDSLHLYDNQGRYWRDSNWNFPSLPQHFKENGYETVSIGKVFHHGVTSNSTDDYPNSWSQLPYQPSQKDDESCPTLYGDRLNLLCPIKADEENLTDSEVADYAVNYLINRSKDLTESRPFFLAVGFYKPHIPFKVPSKYFDLHPLESMDAPFNVKPEGMPEVAWNPWSDLRTKDDVTNLNISFPFGPVPKDFQKHIRQGYYASVSYIDDQLGKILGALELSDYAKETMIILLSDHGFALGEHGEWSKHSNFDVALKVPLLSYVPDLTEILKDRKPFQHISVSNLKRGDYAPIPAKFVADEFIELVDVFPTLCESANIAIPPICPEKQTLFCSDGISFFPVIFEHVFPSLDFSWKTAVYSQYPRPSHEPRNDSDQPLLKHIKIMGYTIKDSYYRYTRWVKFNSWSFQPHWGTFEAHELYDIRKDPQEINNLVEHPDYADIVIKLFGRLKKGWRKDLPYAVHSSSVKHRYKVKVN